MSDALVLIDIQNDYFPGGRMEVVNAEEAVGKARSLLEAFRKNNLPVVHVQHISTRQGAAFFLAGTAGAAIHESVLPRAGEKIITKHFPNSFRGTDLEDFLRANSITAITFCGMMSHMCIDATVRAAFDKGFACTVAEDACATRDLEHGGIAVRSAEVHAAYMAALGAVYAEVAATEQIIKRLDAA